MRCYICDKTLTDKEVVYDDDLKAYDPCSTCMEIILDTAYSDGYVHADDETAVLDTSFDYGDASDIVSFNSWWKDEDYAS